MNIGKQELIVSDTNIFVDLFDTKLLKEFFALPYEIKTTMLVFSEIRNDRQLQAIKPFVDNKKLAIERLTDKEFKDCFTLKLTTPGDLSIADCSVWQTAKKHNARLLTSDRNLRKAAEKDNLKVHGILFVFEEMLFYNFITYEKAAESVKILEQNNKRFPKKIAESKLKEWKTNLLKNKSQQKTKSFNDFSPTR